MLLVFLQEENQIQSRTSGNVNEHIFKNAAKAKYDVYPSAYANGYAVQVCKGKMPGLDGEKRCSGKYCSGKK